MLRVVDVPSFAQTEAVAMARTFRRCGARAALALAACLSLACAARAGEDLTLKERLSDKASDEQRVDNCRVPVERRGTRRRPGCTDASASATVTPKLPPPASAREAATK
jgi:hypothetical protein